jgi:hypothetical protein
VRRLAVKVLARRRDVRNTTADEGRHRADVGGQPPGAVSAQQAPSPPAEGERAGPHQHHNIPGALEPWRSSGFSNFIYPRYSRLLLRPLAVERFVP